MNDRVRVDIENSVATVMLNRPDKHNAVDLAMFEALAEAGNTLKHDNSVRAVVLHGNGANFCAGIDVSVFAGEGIGAVGDHLMDPGKQTPANLFQSVAWVWQEVPVPVIAALQGVVFGAGLQIALGADIRYAAPDARFSIMEAKWGLIPDMAISVTARAVVPLDRLKELAYTARTVAAAAALDLGLITAVHDDPLAAARKTAHEIASRSPSAVRSMKQLFGAGWLATDAELLALEARLQAALLGSEHQRESVLANIEKRAPIFGD